MILLLCIVAASIGYRIGWVQAQQEALQQRPAAEEPPSISGGAEPSSALREPLKPQHEYAPKDVKAPPPPPHRRAESHAGAEPRLVIVIDDVAYTHDVDMIRSTGLKLVMSFLPPSPRHPGTAELARFETGYMVHLPLEAAGFADEEAQTLRTGSSEEEISRRIAELKELYPRVRYMNNHTGSTFTADEASMERLLGVLRQEGIVFVDSRTTAQTKVPAVSERYGLRYLGRDVFLDHQDGVENVKRQIAEAVDKAKKHGTAIAIGHPRPDTIQALIESKKLLGEVRLVGIDEI